MANEIKDFTSIFELLGRFSNEQECIDHLERLRWNGNVVSPFNPTSQVYKCKGNKYKCRSTNKYFNVKTGTIFDDTKIPLQKWFMALYIFSSHKKGISSHQLAKDIAVTQKSAWFMLHRLRYAFNHPTFKAITGTIVELDETYYGGAEKNKHKDKKTKGSQGRSTKAKKPIFGMLERNGNVVAQVVDKTDSKTIQPIICYNVPFGAKLMSDEWWAYNGLSRAYDHSVVKHAANQYVNGLAHTNGLEGFWSHMKRGLDGIYHWASVKHLQAYVDEFSLRFNTRTSTTCSRFDLILANVAGKRLTYKTLTNEKNKS